MLSIVLAGLVFSPFAGSSGIATYASIRGTVTTGYPSYKPVANAQVVVSGETDKRETRTDANGRYAFLALLPGVYHVYVPCVLGIAIYGPRTATTLVMRPTGTSTAMYAAEDNARLRACYESANAPVELSAGLAYFANFDLVTHCA